MGIWQFWWRNLSCLLPCSSIFSKFWMNVLDRTQKHVETLFAYLRTRGSIYIQSNTSHKEGLFEDKRLCVRSWSLWNLIVMEFCSSTDRLRLRPHWRQVWQQPGHWRGWSPEQLGQLPLHPQRQPGRPRQGWQGRCLWPRWRQWQHSRWQRQLSTGL